MFEKDDNEQTTESHTSRRESVPIPSSNHYFYIICNNHQTESTEMKSYQNSTKSIEIKSHQNSTESMNENLIKIRNLQL